MTERRKHSLLGASSAPRWFICPGSPRLCANAPEQPEDDEWRQEGVIAHEVGARCLTNGQEAWEFSGVEVKAEDGATMVPDEEMIECVQLYLDTIRKDLGDVQPPDLEAYVEYAVAIESVDDDCYGTADCGFVSPAEELLRVYDYKHGVGLAVEVEWNVQAMQYAAGFVEKLAVEGTLEFDTVEIIIVQPRHEHPDGPVRRWRISVTDLGAWVQGTFAEHVRATKRPDAPLVCSDQCRFCPAKLRCPAVREKFDDFAAPDVVAGDMEDWELAERLARVVAVRKLIGAIEDEALRRMMHGRAVPGWKLVKQKSNRVFKPGAEEAARQAFGSNAYERKFRSPTGVDRLTGGKAFTREHAYKPQTGLTLAHQGDKRGEVTARTAQEVFAAFIDPH